MKKLCFLFTILILGLWGQGVSKAKPRTFSLLDSFELGRGGEVKVDGRQPVALEVDTWVDGCEGPTACAEAEKTFVLRQQFAMGTSDMELKSMSVVNKGIEQEKWQSGGPYWSSAVGPDLLEAEVQGMAGQFTWTQKARIGIQTQKTQALDEHKITVEVLIGEGRIFQHTLEGQFWGQIKTRCKWVQVDHDPHYELLVAVSSYRYNHDVFLFGYGNRSSLPMHPSDQFLTLDQAKEQVSAFEQTQKTNPHP